MSLTLNDEQERAIRKWFAEQGTQCLSSRESRLVAALGPLMKPWRMSGPFEHQIVRNDAENGSVEIKCFGSTMKYYQGLARRVCDLLNESEGK